MSPKREPNNVYQILDRCQQKSVCNIKVTSSTKQFDNASNFIRSRLKTILITILLKMCCHHQLDMQSEWRRSIESLIWYDTSLILHHMETGSSFYPLSIHWDHGILREIGFSHRLHQTLSQNVTDFQFLHTVQRDYFLEMYSFSRACGETLSLCQGRNAATYAKNPFKILKHLDLISIPTI